MRNLEESRNFIIKPQEGQIVKVYTGSKKNPAAFGVTLKIIFLNDREVVLLKRLNCVSEMQDIDFYLESYKVEFEDVILEKKTKTRKTKFLSRGVSWDEFKKRNKKSK